MVTQKYGNGKKTILDLQNVYPNVYGTRSIDSSTINMMINGYEYSFCVLITVYLPVCLPNYILCAHPLTTTNRVFVAKFRG